MTIRIIPKENSELTEDDVPDASNADAALAFIHSFSHYYSKNEFQKWLDEFRQKGDNLKEATLNELRAALVSHVRWCVHTGNTIDINWVKEVFNQIRERIRLRKTA